MTKNGQEISYRYNTDGIRTEKTENGKTTKYHLAGDKVTYETDGTDSIYYTYDANDNLISMNLNGSEYYYVRNGQNDIIGLFDSNGTRVVSYTYDTWGKPAITDTEKNDPNDTIDDGITGSLADTVGVKNPYRYRGYYYDSESGLYYLNSRYYSPEWGRYLNADDPQFIQKLVEEAVSKPGKVNGELFISNAFAYCGNNPVINSDPSGYWFWAVIGTVVGGASAYAVGKAVGLNGWKLALFTVAGAAVGALVGNAASGILRTIAYSFINWGKAIGIESVMLGYKLMIHWPHHGKGIHIVVQKLTQAGNWRQIFEKSFFK